MVFTEDGWTQFHTPTASPSSTKMNGNSPLHLPIENDARVNAVGKSHCFRMMVWLCAYYDFYNEKVYQCHSQFVPHLCSYTCYPSQITSELLCNMMGNQLAPYLQEEGYVRLIQCFLNPKLLLSHPESPNPLQDDTPVLELVPGGGHRRLERGGKKIDPLYLLFMPNEHQQNGENVGQWCILLQVVDCHIHFHRSFYVSAGILLYLLSFCFTHPPSPAPHPQTNQTLNSATP